MGSLWWFTMVWLVGYVLMLHYEQCFIECRTVSLLQFIESHTLGNTYGMLVLLFYGGRCNGLFLTGDNAYPATIAI